MDSTQASQNKFLFSLVAALIVGGIVSVAVDPYLPSALSNAKKGYQSGFTAARKIAEGSKYGDFFSTPSDMRYISGIVTAVQDNRLTVRVQALSPFDNLITDDRTVDIVATTNITKFVAKDSTAYQKELAAWNASSAGKVTGAVAPSPVTLVPVDRKTITTGITVVVVAAENIKDMKEFAAKEIQVQPKLLLGE